MFNFTPIFPLPILLGLFVLAAAVTVLSYKKIQHTKSTAVLLLRLFALLCLMLLALRPSLKSLHNITQKDRVYTLTDESASMKIKDMPGSQSRLEAKDLFFKKNAPLIQQLQKAYDVKEYSFASQLGNNSDTHFSDKLTAIGSALNTTAKEEQIQKVQGILLFSDGLSNNGLSINKAISSLKKLNIPVHTIPIGKESYQGEIVDGQIIDLHCPQKIKRKNDLNLKVQFSLRGLKDKVIKLQFLIGGQLIRTEEVTPKSKEQDFEKTVALKTNDLSAGYHKVTVVAVTGDKEITPLNNSFDHYFQVLEASLELLLIATSPSPEFKFLNRTLSSFQDMNVSIPNPFYLRSQEGKQFLEKIKIEDYDLIIFQNPDLEIIPAAFIEKCQNSIANARLGILFSGASIHKKFSDKGLFKDLIFSHSNHGELISEAGHISLTSEGNSHFITDFLKNTDLQQWPEIDGVSSNSPVTQSSQTLLKIGKLPLLLTATHRNNRTGWLNTNALWQLTSHKQSKKEFGQLWLRIIYYLTSRENILSTKLSLFAPESRVQTNTVFTMLASLIDSKSLPVKNSKVSLIINTPDATTQQYPMKNLSDFYEHELTFKQSGLYSLKAKTTLNNAELLSNEVQIHVVEPRIEFDRILTDKTIMQNIAKSTNGQSTTLEELPKLLQDLITNAQLRTVSKVTNNKDLWDNLFSYLLIALLLCAEWQLRRMRDLP